MRSETWNILLIDDDEDDFVMTRSLLNQVCGNNFKLEWAETFEAGRGALAVGGMDVVLVDYNLGQRNGLELVRESVSMGFKAPFILVTGFGDYQLDLEAMRAGASDYLGKAELNPILLERVIRYAIERKRSEEKYLGSRKELEFLADSAVRFLHLSSEDDIFHLTADLVYELVNPSIVVVNEFDFEQGLTIVRSFRCSTPELEEFERIFGQLPIGLALKFTEETRERMQAGKLSLVNGGLHDLTFYQLPLPLCQEIERSLSLGNIYAIPFSYEEDFLGTVAILTHHQGQPEKSQVVEGLISQAGIALKRRQAEQALKKALGQV